MSVPVRGCVAGVCLDPVAECDRRCLAARVVRGDPCDMLRSCRCAPLAGDPSRDADGDGRPDVEACRERFSLGDPAACMDAARRESTTGLDPLPSADCPDADGFVDDLQPAEDL